jgi:hypothetical protein
MQREEHMKDYHFFAASAFTYATTTDERNLQDLIKLMSKEKLTFNLFLVPCPFDSDYAINFYQPQVKGTMFLDTFSFKNKK